MWKQRQLRDSMHPTSRLQVVIPSNLQRPNGYDHREALFGIPPFGGSIQQKLYYANSTFCGPDLDNAKGYPIETHPDGTRKPWEPPFILMVDRGQCTFVQKVRNAQRAGAAGVLIADHTCVCDVKNCTDDTSSGVCEYQEPMMADDGSGGDVTIPPFLMFKQDADLLKTALITDHAPITVKMEFSLPAPDDRVEYDLWAYPSDWHARDFVSTFGSAALALGEHAFFTPQIFVFNGTVSGCRENHANVCGTLCINEGRYCATDPDGDLYKGISGADVVTESLRLGCIWQEYGEDGIGKQWWRYSEEFAYRCNDPNKKGYFSDKDCIADAMNHAGVDQAAIQACMDKSGLGNQENSILEGALKIKSDMGVQFVPVSHVNQVAVRGKLSFSTIFRAICAGFLPGSEPDICKKCAMGVDEAGCVNGVTPSFTPPGASDTGNNVSMSFYVTSTIFLVAILAGFFVFQRKKMQDRMRSQVRGILAEYMPLEEQDSLHPSNDLFTVPNASEYSVPDPDQYASKDDGSSQYQAPLMS